MPERHGLVSAKDRNGLGSFLDPIAQFDVLPDLTPLVAVFLGFARPIIDLPERMLRVPDRVGDDFQCFWHNR